MTTETYTYARRPGAPGAPLVFAFHGTGGDETQFMPLVAEILPQAEIIAPRGDVSEFGANRFFRRTGEGVYDMPDLAARTRKMADFVAAHKAAHPGRRVIGLGYSNGANILASAIFERPDLFGHAALMHPLIPFAPQVRPGLELLDILITAGARDPICPAPGTAALAAFFETHGARVRSHVHPGGHEIRQDEIAAVAEFLRTASAPA